ncbi:hypothetical protein QFC19_009111 [Naganishia cerealis]|uniref:Uncharacterized protein n=1 Tax=Naganishia cerealis TaxID=610337 RepID=A0ACC2UXB9_9TREE|nr:hypothetical protein QFC19_009111 [Naganishia cerealis]
MEPPPDPRKDSRKVQAARDNISPTRGATVRSLVSIRNVVEDISHQELLRDLQQGIPLIFPQALSTIDRYKTLCTQIGELTLEHEELLQYHDAEFEDVDRIIEIYQIFLIIRIEKSRAPNRYTGKEEYFRGVTLRDMSRDLVAVAAHIGKLSKEDLEHLKRQMKATCHGLIIMFGLRMTVKSRVVFSRHDIQLLIETVMKSPHNVLFAIQFWTIMLLLWYTGARGGSLFVTDSYSTYIKIKDVEIYRAKLTPQEHRVETPMTFGFNVRITLRHFKGYQNTNRILRVTYRIDSISRPKNLDFDLGMCLIVMLHKRGAFGKDVTVEELFDGPELRLRPLEDYMEQPLFLGSVPGGRHLADPNDKDKYPYRGAMTANAFNIALRKYCKKANLAQNIGDGLIGTNAFRKGMATTARKFGKMDDGSIQYLLGHRHGSRTMRERYDYSMATLNVAGGLLQGEQLNFDAPDITEAWLEAGPRPPLDAPNHIPPERKLKDIVKADIVLQEMAMDILIIERAIECKSDEWMELSIFQDSAEWKSSEDVTVALAMTRAAFRERVKYWRDGDWRTSARRQQDLADMRDAVDIQERIRQAEEKQRYDEVDDSINTRLAEMKRRNQDYIASSVEAARAAVLSSVANADDENMIDPDENSRVEIVVNEDEGEGEEPDGVENGSPEEISVRLQDELMDYETTTYWNEEVDQEGLRVKIARYTHLEPINDFAGS